MNMVHWESGTPSKGLLACSFVSLRDCFSRNTPTAVRGDLSSLTVVGTAGGQYHSLFIVSDGRVFCTGGDNPNLGLLGLGDTTNRCLYFVHIHLTSVKGGRQLSSPSLH